MSTIVITGASSGLGEALALRLAQDGHQVCGMARTSTKLEAVKQQAGDHFHIYPVDVRDAGQIEQAFADIEQNVGPIDVLVNNAAVYKNQPLAEMDLETIATIIDTNLKGIMYCTRLVLPYMLARGAGRIINIASVAGTRGIPRESAYVASKHGMVGFANAVNQEIIPQGVSIATLCPGGINTPLWNEDNPYGGGDVSETIDPEEIVDLIEFLLAHPASTIYKNIVFFPKQEWH